MEFLVRIRPVLILLAVAVMMSGIVRAATLPTPTETKSESGSAAPSSDQPGSEQAPQGKTEASGGEAQGGPAENKAGSKGAEAPQVRPFGSTRPGTYRFRNNSMDQSGQERTSESSVVIEDGQKTASSLRQFTKVTISQPSGGSGGSGQFTQEGEWRPDALYNIGYKGQNSQGEFGCNWEPPQLTLMLPLKVGRNWKSDSTCTAQVTIQGQQQTSKTRQVMSSKVTATQQLTIAGQTIEVFVIQDQTSFESGTGTFTSTSNGNTTRYYSVAHGLSVKTTSKGTSRSGGQERTYSSENELLNLDPE